MRNRRLLRMMAGEIKSPSERYVERIERREARAVADLRNVLAWADKIERRQANDPELPPMPLNFAEIERRRREGMK